MWTCTRCNATVDDGFELCWACGAGMDGSEDPDFIPERDGIIAAEHLPKPADLSTYADWASLTLFSMAPEAYAIQAALQAEGIPVFLAAENTSTLGPWAGANGIRVQVPREFFEEAREILEEHEFTRERADDDE